MTLSGVAKAVPTVAVWVSPPATVTDAATWAMVVGLVAVAAMEAPPPVSETLGARPVAAVAATFARSVKGLPLAPVAIVVP